MKMVKTKWLIVALSLLPPASVAAQNATTANGQGAFGNVALKVNVGDAVRYVSSHGSDRNDGLSWGTAKASIMAAYDSLASLAHPGGTIEVCSSGQNVPVDSGGHGLWIMGPADPHYASPPAGWRKQMSVLIKGVCEQTGGLDHVTWRIGYGLWLSSIDGTNGLQIIIENLDFRYGQYRLGFDSNGNQTSTSGVFTQNNGVVLKNDAFAMCNGNCTSTTGPDLWIGGGDTYGVWIDHTSVQGNHLATPGTDPWAAIDVHAGSTTGGDSGATITNSYLSGTGVLFYPNGSGGNYLIAKDLSSEAVTGALVWETGGAFNSSVIWISGLFNADPVSGYDVRIDDSVGVNSIVSLCNVPRGIYAPNAPEGSIQVCGANNQGSNAVGDPLTQGQNVVSAGRYFGFDGQIQRMFAPRTVRYANIANTSSAAWTAFPSGAALTTRIAAPDGSTGAASASYSGGTNCISTNACGVTFYSGIQSLAVGQYFIGGFFFAEGAMKSPYGNGVAAPQDDMIAIGGSGNVASCKPLRQPVWPTEEWQWVWEICKLTVVRTTPATVSLSAHLSQSLPISVYAPILITIPVRSLPNGSPEDEAYEIANNLTPYSSNCEVGTLCGLSGVPIVATQFGTPRNPAVGWFSALNVQGGGQFLAKGSTCTMSSGTRCTATVPAGSTACVATVQGSSVIAGACSISGTTLTVTAASSNSDTWAWVVIR